MGRVGNAERISFTPAARELYCRPDGSPKRVGDRVVNRDYGAVLRAIAKGGVESFYRGEIADAVDADMRSHGGLLRRSEGRQAHAARVDSGRRQPIQNDPVAVRNDVLHVRLAHRRIVGGQPAGLGE